MSPEMRVTVVTRSTASPRWRFSIVLTCFVCRISTDGFVTLKCVWSSVRARSVELLIILKVVCILKMFQWNHKNIFRTRISSLIPQENGVTRKPNKPRDFYHTCYCLSGLSVAHYGGGAVVGDYANRIARTRFVSGDSRRTQVRILNVRHDGFKGTGNYIPSMYPSSGRDERHVVDGDETSRKQMV